MVVSGLALHAEGEDDDGRPLVITLGELPDTGNVTAVWGGSLGGEAAPLQFLGQTGILAAETAFKALAVRGWRCGGGSGSGQASAARRSAGVAAFQVQLWRARLAVRATEEHRLPLAWGAHPDESWLGAAVHVVARPFSAPVGSVITSGVVSNISMPSGLLLVDARCVGGTAGGGVALQGPAGRRGGMLVACLAPVLRSTSSETIAVSVALPLQMLAQAVLKDKSCANCLYSSEAAALATAIPDPSLRRGGSATTTTGAIALPQLLRPTGCAAALVASPSSELRARAKAAHRSVALLWLQSGSWASAVVISRQGHLVTCAHLLTGKSWMEEQEAKPGKGKTPPQTCRGVAQARVGDGGFEEVSFEAEVLHVFGGCHDVALLRVKARGPSSAKETVVNPFAWHEGALPDLDAALRRAKAASATFSSSPREASAPPMTFDPLPWHEGPAPDVGAEVLAVGYGLFGPETPWQGPVVTKGSLVKVARDVGAAGGRASLLQSSAAVHRGCSGGALVDVASGKLLGLLIVNVTCKGSVMPHMNFSVPVELLAPYRRFAMDQAAPGAAAREALDASMQACAANEYEQTLWRLEQDPWELPSAMQERKQQALALLQRLADDATAKEEATKEQAAREVATAANPAKGVDAHQLRTLPTPRAAL